MRSEGHASPCSCWWSRHAARSVGREIQGGQMGIFRRTGVQGGVDANEGRTAIVEQDLRCPEVSRPTPSIRPVGV